MSQRIVSINKFDGLRPQGEVMAKIVQFHEKGGPEVLKLEEVTLLPVAENDVRFRVHAISLNRAESMYRKGAYLQDYTWPSRVGYEASGVVEAIGKNVARVGAMASTFRVHRIHGVSR